MSRLCWHYTDVSQICHSNRVREDVCAYFRVPFLSVTQSRLLFQALKQSFNASGDVSPCTPAIITKHGSCFPQCFYYYPEVIQSQLELLWHTHSAPFHASAEDASSQHFEPNQLLPSPRLNVTRIEILHTRAPLSNAVCVYKEDLRAGAVCQWGC